MLQELRPATLALLILGVITGLVYPLVVTAVAQVAFPSQANGSLISVGDRVVGSRLIGQDFHDARYFWGRLSATSPACNAGSSSGSNFGPLNPALIDAAKARIAAISVSDGHPPGSDGIPVDLVTASGSGLDPDISPASARYQMARVAAARKLPLAAVARLVEAHVEDRTFGVLGEPRVNVLELNLALDRLR